MSKHFLATMLICSFVVAWARAADDTASVQESLRPPSSALRPQSDPVANFMLDDCLGSPRSLSDYADKKAVVIVFLGTECPLARHYGPRLADLDKKFGPGGVQFLGINANCQDSLAEIAQYARTYGVEFPILKDPRHEVADLLSAERTPEVLLLGPDRVVQYRGRIDDQYGVGYVRPQPKAQYLAEALADILAGRPVATPSTEPVGCMIGRSPDPAAGGKVTYAAVAPVFTQHCVRCHRPGQIAPFSLTRYDDVVAWRDTIREVIDQGRMPPWHADPQYGHFFNDARLPSEARELVFRWIDEGAPRGDWVEPPEPEAGPSESELAESDEGWRIPKPDLVLKMKEPFEVPEKGVVSYQYFEVHPGFDEDKWIQAAEARPGNPAVTHHLILFFHPPGDKPVEPGEALFNSLASFAPGMPAAVYGPGIARRIPAGSKLMLQAHYTPNGKRHTDLSQAGIVFAERGSIRKEAQIKSALNWEFRIPPGALNHEVQARYRFEQDAHLYSLTPHMHLRGKSFRFEAQYPDGKREVLLSVPRYDFNWQNFYIFAETRLMPEGTEIICTAHYDNSEANLANPDPAAQVTWGDQTWEEMMVGSLAIALADQDLAMGPPQVRHLEGDQYEAIFTYRPSTKVEAVYLAGAFNEWKPADHRMDGPDSDGKYTTRLVLPRGLHEYKFVIDGTRWRADPGNREQVGFYHNSLLRVGE